MGQGTLARTTAMATACALAAGTQRASAAMSLDANGPPGWAALAPDLVVVAIAFVLACAGAWLLVSALRGAPAAGFWVRRHASGFGGSSTGWQMSGALVKTGCGLALVALAVLLAMARVPVRESSAGEGGGAHARSDVAAAASASSAAGGGK